MGGNLRVEKFKNLQNNAWLSSLLCYLMCPGLFGGDFLIFPALGFCPLEKLVAMLWSFDQFRGIY